MPDDCEPLYKIPRHYERATLADLKRLGALGLAIRCIRCGHEVLWPFPWLAKAMPGVMDQRLEYLAERLRCRVCRSPRIYVRPYRKLPLGRDD